MGWNQISDFIVLDPGSGSALTKFCGSGSTFDQYGSTSLESCLSVCSKENRLKEKSVWFWLASMPARNVLAGLRMIDRYTREKRWREGKKICLLFMCSFSLVWSRSLLTFSICISVCLTVCLSSVPISLFFSLSRSFTPILWFQEYILFSYFLYFHTSIVQGVKPNSFEKVESEEVKEIIDVCIRLKKEER